ncbi:MAG: hypothetical protein KC488_02530, partial [Candidatus Cloacimonetes bacterium]|nr:hypothetical protein [Candidatus Cloacimonadota bacterium]
ALPGLVDSGWSDRVLYSVELHQKHMFRRCDGQAWIEERYWSNPEEYESNMDRILPHLQLLVNGILWNAKYPRLVSRDLLARQWQESAGVQRPRVIADISIDIEGSIECSVKATHSDEPCYTYHPETRTVRDGIHRTGVVIMAVDNLPCELPRDSSETFSAALAPLVPYLTRADFSRPFEELDLPAPLRRAVILHHGRFTPDYHYMSRFINGAGA